MRTSARLIACAAAGGLLGVLPPAAAHAATLAGARPGSGALRLTGAAAPSTAALYAAVAARTGGPSGITAKGAYLYDATRGKKLWGRATGTKRPIGSMTKVMTALLVIRAGHLGRTVTVKKAYVDHVRHNDASSAGLRTGDKVTVRQLLYGMMLPSGCDAAYALADVYGKGNKKFVARMNSTARSLGMTHTRFLDADGLPTSSHKEGYSTPHDLITLTRAAMKSATFRDVVAHQTYKLGGTSHHHAYRWTNTNLLLGSYSGAIGIKTGHTDHAGYCLLFAARRSGRTLYGLLLNSTTTDPNRRFRNAATMLDWGFGTKPARIQLRSLPAGAPTD